MANNDLLISASFRLTYQDTLDLVAQQIRSKLRPFVSEKPMTGKATAASDLVGSVKARRRASKDRSNFENNATFARRWLVLRDEIESGQYIDEEDVLRRVNNARGELMRTHMASVMREIDDIILGLDSNGQIDIGGILGTVVEGETPSTTVAFPSSQILPAGAAGLTMAKLKSVREQFALADYDLDLEEPVMAISPKQMTDLLGIVEAAGSAINLADQAQLVEGKVSRFMRMNFIEINRLPKSGTTRTTAAWMPSNVVLGIHSDVKGDIWNDTHAGNTPYMEVDARVDATRKQDTGVIAVECIE